MNKLQKILIGVLAAQVVLAAFVFWPKPKTAENTDLVMGDRTADQVTAVSVADSAGNVVNLAKVEDAWVLPDVDQYPVDSGKVTSMLEDIFSVRYGRMVTETASSHDRLEVGTEKFNRKITMTFDSGSTQTIYVGSSPTAGATNFRMDGEDQVYLTDQLTTYSYGTGNANWINTSLVTVSSDTVQHMTLTNAQGTIDFTLQDDGTWTLTNLPEGQQANSDAISSLVSQATAMRITEPLGKTLDATYGMDKPTATLVLSMTDDQGNPVSLTLKFGAVDADAATVVVKSSASDYYAKVSGTSAEKFINSTVADFIAEQATPTTTP